MEAKTKNEQKGRGATATTCPICGRTYTAPPAISREDNKTEICPVCGMAQALSAAGIKEDAAKELLRTAEEKEIAMGRVEARVEARP